MESGKAPQQWKIADVIPIYKSGNKEEPLNYRPVSLTSIVCKLCERIIKKQWIGFLEKENILTKRQFGFKESTNMLRFYSRVIDTIQEREGWADCIYFDLKKAFDKVPHERLLWKLENV